MLGVTLFGEPEFGGPGPGRTVTITEPTEGAVMYVTVDGSRPTPVNYVTSGEGPLSVVGFGGFVKARAYKNGLRASEIGRLELG